jgi:hypothetical protein
MNIDLSRIVTAEDKAAKDLELRLEAGRAECARRILAVARETTQMNLSAAAAAGFLNEADLGAYRQGLIWIAKMRAEWRVLVEAGADLSDDRHWPEAPAAVRDLARRY